MDDAEGLRVDYIDWMKTSYDGEAKGEIWI